MGSIALAAETAFCWAVMAAVWALAALREQRGELGIERKAGRDRASLAAAGAAVAVLIIPARLWAPLALDVAWIRALGLVLLLPGTALAVWARVALGGMWSSGAVTREAHTLRTDGPYGLTRHPIYTGVLAAAAGSAPRLPPIRRVLCRAWLRRAST